MGKLLICSNDEKVRESVKTTLCNDYEMILCEAGDQCGEIIKNTKIKHFIFDVDGQENALETIKTIRELDSKIKVTAVISAKQEKLVKQTTSVGAHNHLTKPFREEVLLKLLKG